MFVSSLPKVTLAHLPTPVQHLSRLLPALLPGVSGLPTLLCKRDDLTGAELTGNKVRKLEFLLAQAQAQGADTVLTCGGAQSNHCRATALAAARLGLSSVLFLRTDDLQVLLPEGGAQRSVAPLLEGNILLDRLCGAQVRYISSAQYRQRAELMAQAAAELAAGGHSPYVIPEGGSNALGSLGYAACVAELAAQLTPSLIPSLIPSLLAKPVTLVHATGSGGTGAGLCLGVALLRLPWRVVGVNVCDDRTYFVRVMGDILEQISRTYGVKEAGLLSEHRDELEILDGHVGRGYALSTEPELALLRDVCRSEGLVLDPVYTGKAMGALVATLRMDPRALGDTVVFLHTGGIFGLFPMAGQLSPLLV